jgi:hypothetical protein
MVLASSVLRFVFKLEDGTFRVFQLEDGTLRC